MLLGDKHAEQDSRRLSSLEGDLDTDLITGFEVVALGSIEKLVRCWLHEVFLQDYPGTGIDLILLYRTLTQTANWLESRVDSLHATWVEHSAIPV